MSEARHMKGYSVIRELVRYDLFKFLNCFDRKEKFEGIISSEINVKKTDYENMRQELIKDILKNKRN